MASSARKLVDVLNAREASMEEMARLLREEQSSIIAFDTKGIEENGQRKAQVLTLMEELDGTCRALVAQAGKELGIAGPCSLSPIIERSQSPLREELKVLQDRIFAAAAEIRRVVADNKRLLESSLGLIGRSLTFFKQRFTVSDTYGYSGQMVERRSDVSVLRKEM